MVAGPGGRQKSRDPFKRDPARPLAPCEAAKVRFSYLWSRVDGAWRIVHHHSSFNLSAFSSCCLLPEPRSVDLDRPEADEAAAASESQFVYG